MQAQQITEFKKVATIGYIVSGLGLGLWSSALLPRLNLAAVGAVASSVALSPLRKRQTEQAIADAKKQLDADHAERREQLKGWEKELQARSVDLDARQMDLDRELERLQRLGEAQQRELDLARERWGQERTIADRTADSEIRDRSRQLEAEYAQRFEMRQKEIEQEYATLDVERKSLDADLAQFEAHRDRELAAIAKERELAFKEAQETVHTGLADLEAQSQEIEVQARQWVADALEPMHEEIAALQGENEALREQLAVATYPKIPRGVDRVCIYLKEIIPALYQLGFKLDYDHHDTNPNRDRVWFRPQNTFDLKQLDQQSGLIQGLIGSKHPLSWQWIDKGLIQLEVSTAGVETSTKTSKRKIADRIVDGEQWLIDLVDKCFHFRISGENGSGKSEFFNNLFCIAKHRVFDGKLDLTLIDPKFPLSPWIIEGQPFVPQYRSWEDAPNGVADMAALVDARIQKASDSFKPQDWLDGTTPEFTPSMWAIDETDTTMSRYKKEIKDNLRVGLKVGRALRVMVCYMCQSYLPSDIGLNHPDLKASATILLSTSAEEGADDLPMSKERRLEIKEEIAYLNAEGCKYFALVKYPGVQPFVARLPKPKAYSHLQFEGQSEASPLVPGKNDGIPSGDNGVARVALSNSKGLGDLCPQEAIARKSDLGGVGDATFSSPIAPASEASQSEIERVVGLLSDGMKSQEKIVKTVWGVSRSGRKGSKYQRKVEVVKAIRAQLKL